MDTKRKVVGATLAASIGLLLQGCAATVTPTAENGLGYDSSIIQTSPQVGNQILCYGVNSCRGQSACQIVTTSCRNVNKCKGQNSCKGKGGTYMTIPDCHAAGGVVPSVPADQPGPAFH